MSTVSLPFFSAPLAVALEKTLFHLKREGNARIIVATPQMDELLHNGLPSHIQVIHRPLTGKRIQFRNARHFKQTRLRVAHYPEAHMDETAVPELLCVIEGMAHICVGDYILQCKPGDFILIPPMVPKGDFSYAVDNNPHNICEVFHLYSGHLSGEGLECWIARSQGAKIETGFQLGAALVRNTFLATFFNHLCDIAKTSPRSETAYFLICSLVLLLQQELHEKRPVKSYIEELQFPPQHTVTPPIHYALSYIESHINEPLTIDSMARQTALSTTSFKRLFKEATGLSFHQYLTARRLQMAGQLLKESEDRVQEIAERVGLSPSRLHSLFQDRFSCSPGEYRKHKKTVLQY